MTSCRCARTRIGIESAANWQECYHQSVKVFSSFFPCGRQTKIPRFKRLLFLVASFRDRKRMHDCLSLAFEVFPLSLISNGLMLWHLFVDPCFKYFDMCSFTTQPVLFFNSLFCFQTPVLRLYTPLCHCSVL